MYNDLANDDMEEVNEKGKKVAPELFDNNRLQCFQEEFLPALKNLCGWFTVILEKGLDIETVQEYFY